MQHVLEFFSFNKSIYFIIFASMIIVQTCESFDLVFHQISQDDCSFGGVSQFKAKEICDILLIDQKNIFWEFGELFIVEVKNGSVSGGQVFKELFEVGFFSDDKWKGVNSSMVFELDDDPVHDGHESSALGFKHASV